MPDYTKGLRSYDGRAVKGVLVIDRLAAGFGPVNAADHGGCVCRYHYMGDHSEVIFEFGDGSCISLRDVSEWTWAEETPVQGGVE